MVQILYAMYVNGNTIFVETIPGMEEDEGE
jgi:hypothetical protein